MSARAALRAATRADHERVDALFSAHDLCSREGYRRFLERQAAAHLPVERAIDAAGAVAVVPDWAERRRAAQLRADLADLEASPAEQDFVLPGGREAMLGALYVLEGSRLGGAVLRQRIPAGLPQRFLSADRPGAWRALTALLDRELGAPAALAEAIAGARSVFDCFARAANLHPEPCH